ncbi:TorF family putative porin [Cupriavidus sp. MP-37]|uniref:TorF family putative porin n=1 Tax=Cupriavidus sp. MP-37 TaxID=2884455 RepID=UPI001D0A6438|nr:TorF family putative porin [Cupriavidus sp. MP-37]UDM48893.1 TorF family putative porin [Cupriavidus sp. MP-37]
MTLLRTSGSRHAAPAAIAAALWLASATPALAQAAADTADAAATHTFNANLALASDYRYRGLTQSNARPALQGGFDYSHASGFYLGNWNSSISWLGDSHPDVSAPIEMDFYGGYRHAFGDSGWSTDVGVLQYYYPGSYPDRYTSPDTTELYAGVGYGPVTLKYSYAPTNLFGMPDSRHSWYADLSANLPLGVWGLTLNADVGYQKVQVAGASYADWKLGLTKDLGHGFALALAYLDTNADRAVYTSAKGRYLGRATVWGSLSKTF